MSPKATTMKTHLNEARESLPGERSQEFYRQIYLIRRFEEMVLQNFPRGIFFGTTHTYLGQEANAVGVLSWLSPQDVVFSNHRCHGHFLAYGGDVRALLAELMGKSTGVCGGRGGSQHLHWRNFYSNGIQGGIVPTATGMALAEKHKDTQAVTVVFLGDGTLGEGVVYEALNMASLWGAPIVYVLENNSIAQTTPIEMNLAGEIKKRFEAFDIPVVELDTSDVEVIAVAASTVLQLARRDQRPHALILHTRRFGAHSKGDDTRSTEHIASMRRTRDPLSIQGERLDPEAKTHIETQINFLLEAALEAALADPYPTLEHGAQ